MSKNSSTFKLGLIEMAVEAHVEGLLPEQIIRRLGLHGYAEVDLEEVISEFNVRIARLRGYFNDRRSIEAGFA